MSTDQLGAGTVFEVKYLFAIDSIAAVYRGRSKLNKTREHTSVSILSRYEPTAESSSKAHSTRVSGRLRIDIFLPN
jgi:hypothetical protein